MQTPFIIHNNEADEYFFEEGCYILEVSNTEKDESVSIARARLSPNTATRLHKLSNTIERYIIVSGEGMVTVGDLPETLVQANDVVIIPENCPQMIRNTGDADLLFFVVCNPRFVADNYSDC